MATFAAGLLLSRRCVVRLTRRQDPEVASLEVLLPLQRIPAALCSSGAAGLRTILLRRFARPASFHPDRAGFTSPLQFLSPSRSSFPSRIVRSPGRLGVAPRAIRARVLLYCLTCSVTDPPPGVVAAWPNLMPSITTRRSGNVHGVRSVLAALRSLHPAWRVLACSQATLPRAVEPRAARDVFDVRHRCPEPADLVSGPGPSCAPASGLSPRRPAVPTNWCSPA